MHRPAGGAAALVLAVLAALPAVARAAATSSVDAGTLTITIDGDPTAVSVTCDAGDVTVNGADPGTGQADCGAIAAIFASGGPGADTIDLSGVTAGDYAALDYISVDAGGGNDTVI